MADPLNVYEIIQRAGVESDPQRALGHLIEDCVARTDASAGRLYLLDLSRSAYVEFPPSDSRASQPPALTLLDTADGVDDRPLRQAILERKVVRIAELGEGSRGRSGSPHAQSRLIVPILRDCVCLGAIDLDSTAPHHFTNEHMKVLQVAAIVALLLCEKDDVLQLLTELQNPVDYRQSFDGFLDEMMLVVAKASQMPLITLRELRDDTLHCLKAYGFTDRTEDDLHLSPLSTYPFFAEVVNSRRIVKATRQDLVVQSFLDKLGLATVQHFTIFPVLVGKDVFGTLSFAALCDHEYTPLEQHGLQVVANAVGVAISNYRNFRMAEEQLFEHAKIGAAITTVDVAQSARHEARNHLQEAQESLALLSGKSNGLSSKPKREMKDLIDQVSSGLQSVEGALQKIKAITKPPDREKVPLRADALWREAFALAIGRLEQQQIDWRIRGTATIRVAPDYIRTAFLNLVLNSIDAFRSAKKKGRQIDVAIDSPSERAKDVTIRYTDNATGIDSSKLGPVVDGAARQASDIFMPGVTSKPDGSGYGLYLVRKILTEHQGSIDLVDHRNGVTFEIALPLAE